MGLPALAPCCPGPKNLYVPEMTPLLDEITSLIDAPTVDRALVERTLTDGYAHALALETERSRLQRRVGAVTKELQRRTSVEQAQELIALVKKLDGNAGDLLRLRDVLAQLRRRAS
jgi:hypothetical protein